MRLKHVMTLGVCAIALCVIGAGFASGASAVEWIDCVKTEPKNTGKYTDKLCSVETPEANGKYELQPGIGKGKLFKGKSGEVVLHTVVPGTGDIKIECLTGKLTGRPALPNLFTEVTLTLSKCSSLGMQCSSPGGKAGRVTLRSPGGPVAELPPGPDGGIGFGLEEPNPGEEIDCGNITFKKHHPGPGWGQWEWPHKKVGPAPPIEWEPKPRFGEVSPGYIPLVNIIGPGGPSEVLTTEVCEVPGPCSEPLPSGLEGKFIMKGETLGVS